MRRAAAFETEGYAIYVSLLSHWVFDRRSGETHLSNIFQVVCLIILHRGELRKRHIQQQYPSRC